MKTHQKQCRHTLVSTCCFTGASCVNKYLSIIHWPNDHQCTYLLPIREQGDFAFEEDVLQATTCDVHTFDCTIDSPSLDQDIRHHYHTWCLGDRNNHPELVWSAKYKTYPEIIRELNHSSRSLDLLKIDIEGYEYQGMSNVVESTANLPSQVRVKEHTDMFCSKLKSLYVREKEEQTSVSF